MKLAAVALTTDGSESLAMDTYGVVGSFKRAVLDNDRPNTEGCGARGLLEDAP